MNREEQKPEDLLEREVKEEIEDFVDEIEKEPLYNAYHEQFVPKLEEVINLCLPSTSLLPTQNEYLSDTHSFQNSSNASNSSPQNTYQELYVESQNKTPFSCRISIVHKNSLTNQRNTRFILNNDSALNHTFDDNFPRRNVEKKLTNSNSSYEWCSVCKHKNLRKNLVSVSCEEEKLIIMLGSVVRGEKSLANAQVILLENWKIMNISVCFSHFSEVYNEICKVLLITNSSEIVSCSLNLIQMFIPTVNALIPHLTPLQFRTIFNNFTLRNKNLIEMDVPLRLDLEDCQIPNDFLQLEIKQENVKEESMDEYFKQNEPSMEQYSARFIQKQMHVQCQLFRGAVDDGILVKRKKRLRCSVCSQSQQHDRLSQLSKAYEKLLIMVGCILRGQYTHKEAKVFMTRDKVDLVCYSHFPETIDEIYKVLNIKSLHELHWCSFRSIQYVMNIISSLHPQYTISNFHFILNCFASSINKRSRRRNWGVVRLMGSCPFYDLFFQN